MTQEINKSLAGMTFLQGCCTRFTAGDICDTWEAISPTCKVTKFVPKIFKDDNSATWACCPLEKEGSPEYWRLRNLLNMGLSAPDEGILDEDMRASLLAGNGGGPKPPRPKRPPIPHPRRDGDGGSKRISN